MDVTYNIEDFILSVTITYYDLNNLIFLKIGRNIFIKDKLVLHTINKRLFIQKLNNDILLLLYKYLNTYEVNKILLTIKDNIGQILYKDNIIYITLDLNVIDLLIDTLNDLDTIPKIEVICKDLEKEKIVVDKIKLLQHMNLKLKK